jgi:hypothetical protein
MNTVDKVLDLGDSLIPPLIEVDQPCLAAYLNAIEIGSLELIMRVVACLVDSSQSSGPALTLDEFKACLEYFPVFVDDPAMMLVNAQVADFDTYEAATKWYKQIERQPETVPEGKQQDIVMAFSAHLEAQHEELLMAFHLRFKDHTVKVTDEGRIAIGRYD